MILSLTVKKNFAYLERQNKLDGLLTKLVDQSRSYKICLKNENDLNLLENTSITIMIIDALSPNSNYLAGIKQFICRDDSLAFLQ